VIAGADELETHRRCRYVGSPHDPSSFIPSSPSPVGAPEMEGRSQARAPAMSTAHRWSQKHLRSTRGRSPIVDGRPARSPWRPRGFGHLSADPDRG
jgi:hypothetical protein